MGPDSCCCALFPYGFRHFYLPARMKLHRNSTPSGSNEHPSLLRGMQLTCGLQDFMMSLHHQTDKWLDGWLGLEKGRHPSIDPSIEYAWASHFTLQVLLGLQRTSTTYFATRHTTCWLHLTKPFQIVFHQRMQWNGLSHDPPSISKQM